MLLKKILRFVVCTVIFASTVLTAQTKFPVGIYSNFRADTSGANSDYAILDSIKNLGMNWVIHESRSSNKSKLENNFDSVIPLNAYNQTTDAIHYYSSGFYSKWEAEQDTSNGNIGIKHDFGSVSADGSYWTSGDSISNRNKFLIRGPNYYQEKTYKLWINNDRISYRLKIRLKRGDQYLGGSTDTLAEVSITNNNVALVDPYYILVRNVSTAGFTDTTLNYDYSAYPRGNTDIDNSSSHMSRYSSVQQDNTNVQFKVKWYGNYELMVDYLEITDETIWRDYLLNTSRVDSLIQAQITSFNSWSKVKYMYSLDEPGSIDNYIPYKTIQNIVSGHSGKPLVTALVPLDTYTFDFHGEKSIPMWVKTATPEKLLFDLYPINTHCRNANDIDSISGQFNFLRDVCRAANKYKKNNYFYVAQAHGYSKSSNSLE